MRKACMCSYTCVGARMIWCAHGVSDFIRARGRGYPAAPALLGRQELRKPRVEGMSIAWPRPSTLCRAPPVPSSRELSVIGGVAAPAVTPARCENRRANAA